MSQYARVLFIAMLLVAPASTMTSSEVAKSTGQFFDDFQMSFASHSKKGVVEYEDSSTIISKLLGFTRLLGAVILENGLSDDSSPADPLILELLNIHGARSLKDLEKFNKSRMDNFLDKLFGAQIPLVSDVESTFFQMSDLRNSWQSLDADLKKLPKNLTILEDVKTWDTSSFKKVKVADILKLIKDIRSKASSDYKGLKSQLKALANATDKIPKNLDNLNSFFESLEPVSTFSRIMIYLNKNPVSHLSGNFMDQLNPLFDTLKSAPLTDLEVMKLLASKKFEVSKQPGFPNGYLDLKMLPEDKKDLWMLRKVGRPIEVTDRLARLQEPLGRFDSPLNLDKDSMSKITKILSTVFSIEPQTIRAVIGELEKCPKFYSQAGATSKTGKFADKVTFLLVKVLAFRTISQALTQQVKGLFDAVSKPEDLGKIEELITRLKVPLTMLQDDTIFADVVKEIQANSEHVINFATDDKIKMYVDYMKCVGSVKGPIGEVAGVMKLFRMFREQKTTLSNELKKLSKGVATSIGVVPKIRKIVNGIKNQENPAVEALQNLTTYSEEILTVGLVLSTVNTRSSVFESFITSLEALEKPIHAMSLDSNLSEFMRSLDEFQATSGQISTFMEDLKTWKKTMKVEKNASLETYGAIFKEAVKIQDVDLKAEKYLEAIEKLQETPSGVSLKAELKDLKDSIRELEKVEMKFSSFKQSLDRMPEVFQNIMEVLRANRRLKDPVDHSGPTVFWISFLTVLGVLSIAFIVWCWVDYRLPLYYFRHWIWNKIYKNKTVTTAREGKPPSEGFPTPKNDERGPDGREKRKKRKDSSSCEHLPPPPREPDFIPPGGSASTGVSGASSTGSSGTASSGTTSTSKAGSSTGGATTPKSTVPSRSSSSETPPELPRARSPAKRKTSVSGTSRASATSSGAPSGDPSSDAKPSESPANTDPLKSDSGVSKEKGLSVQKIDETQQAPVKKPTAPPPPPPPAVPKKKGTVEKTKTKTSDDNSDEELPPPPPRPSATAPPLPAKAKKKDTLDADSLDSPKEVVKTTSDTKTTRFTQDNRRTLDEIDNKIFDSGVESKNPGTPEPPPPPLPHKKVRARDAKKSKK